MIDRCPMKIALVIPSLGCGGAERVISVLANAWVRRGNQIVLLTFDDGTDPPFYPLEPRIQRLPLAIAGDSSGLLNAIWNNGRRVAVLRSALTQIQPDIAISFIDTTNILTVLAARKACGIPARLCFPVGDSQRLPVIVSERVDPSQHSIGRLWEQLRRWVYPLADGVVVQTEAAAAYFSDCSEQLQARIQAIPNPVLEPPQSRDPVNACPSKTRTAIAVGRLVPQKGYDLLLHAFAQIQAHHPDWNLTILGDGPLRSDLESLQQRLGLTGRVKLPGRQADLPTAFHQADLFVLSSRFEGFPNALCEAMACGLPAIATDCPSGPRDIIRDRIDGILVSNENVDALAHAMHQLMANETARQTLSTRAKEITKRFSIDRILEMWEQHLEQAIQNNL